MSNLSSKAITLFLMAAIITLSGCEFVHTLPMRDAFPVSTMAEPSQPAVVLLPIDEDPVSANPTYLGGGLALISYLTILPYQFMTAAYYADTSRTDLVRIATHSQLNNAGIAVIDQASGGIHQFNTRPEGDLGLSIHLREIKVDTNLSIAMPLVFFNFFIYEDLVSHVALDCQLWQAGNKQPLWEGTVDEHFDDDVQLSDAVAKVVDQCISRSKLVDMRDELIAKRNDYYAQLMMDAVKKQANGDGISALDLFGQASVTAPEASDSEKAFNAMAKQYRQLAQKPALPEEARKFGVQAETAVRNKNLVAAADFYRSQLTVAPWWPQSHYNLALIQAELKRNPDAIVEMQKYLSLVPDAANARLAQDKIYAWEMH